MDQKLSNQPDDLARAEGTTLSLGTEISVASLADASSAFLPGPTLRTKDSIVLNGISIFDRSPSAESKRETNNNLKIFKNEYAMTNQSNMSYKEDVGQQVQRTSPVGSEVKTSIDHSNASEGNDQVLSCETNTVNSHDNTRQQQEVSLDNSHAHLEGSTLTKANSTPTSTPNVTTTSSATTTINNTATNNTPTTNSTNQPESEPQQVPYKPPANNRSILILREIEPTSSESSVRDIFTSENCPSKPIHCEYALQNSWYVTFSDDEDARLALAYIRKHIVKWKGKPIMARYKPKPAVPSAANQPPPHHILPPMVIQQQHQIHPDEVDGVLNATDSSVLLGGNVKSVGGMIASNVSSGHQSPIVMSPHAILNQASGGDLAPGSSPNDGQSASLNNLSGPMPPYGHADLYQAPSLPPHHHHPDGSLVHHPHNHHHMSGPHMMGPPAQPMQHPHQQQQLATGYNLYYGQPGQMFQAPWDLSTVFVYNGLQCPYNKSSVSSVSLVGGAYPRAQDQGIDSRVHHGDDPQQVERKHRRRRRFD